jgi:hypothetical protein
MNGAYLTSLPREMMQAYPPMVDPFILCVPALTHLPASAKSCSWRSTNGMLVAKELSPDNNDSIQSTVAANGFLQVIMKLRRTFIQGSVLMMELRLCHPI